MKYFVTEKCPFWGKNGQKSENFRKMTQNTSFLVAKLETTDIFTLEMISFLIFNYIFHP